MPLQRVRATALARLLNSVERPIYVLDDEGTIVFCNQSLVTTIGSTAIDLLGRRCEYHAGREPTATEEIDSEENVPKTPSANATAAGLCPPPQVMAGQPITGSVSWIDENGTLHQRWARFIPLCEGVLPGKKEADEIQEVICVVGLVDTSDMPEKEEGGRPETPEPVVDERVDLHRRVREFQHAMADEYRVDRLIGDSPAISRARRQVELAAKTRAGVLIVGPPGCGRQHVAKTIHYAGNITTTDSETRGSMIPLDCSVLGPDLIRSTVAAISGPSLGDVSQKSTLLLDEADELPTEAQTELAKIISQQSFRPRTVATSRRPLDELVDEGKFRADLASLLGTIVIDLPPLAKRREDIPLLAQMLVEKENAKGKKQIGGLTTEALDMLDGYDWPGNVDELSIAITEAHQTAESSTVTAADLPKKIHLAADAAAHPHRPQETIVLDDFLAQIERELIERAMKGAKGNKAKAARMLGMTRPRLYRRLIQLGLEKAPPKKEPFEEIDFQEADDDEGQEHNDQ